MSEAAATQTQEAPIQVSRKDLPLSCPMPGATLWSMHPRVYLPIEDEPNKEATCPYCGARYVLTD
ncbi:zinc-finger domain-containing protein [Thiorhodococcus mannitoliphagus]|uniref:Zinc-finger domain-containing protein n=1 Tax=Thiorhodococcus mannitoliphagus TaxID=329406 RepID=A0A6P1DUS0_9GAMM|nr:zinc-finger domain-containing protein [Thiorhodococcus mannitoliphagus]NEX19444.1 zinc-finger domain-containing protein [Thiorhodococcus mannitoliphagus]